MMWLLDLKIQMEDVITNRYWQRFASDVFKLTLDQIDVKKVMTAALPETTIPFDMARFCGPVNVNPAGTKAHIWADIQA